MDWNYYELHLNNSIPFRVGAPNIVDDCYITIWLKAIYEINWIIQRLDIDVGDAILKSNNVIGHYWIQ